MNPDPEAYRLFLLNASQAMQRGDKQAARSWAEKAAAEAPEKEDPWLFLAALASPRASISYLEKALKINPQSERARKGMHWAAGRLRREKASEFSKAQTRADQAVREQTQPHLVITPEQTQPHMVASEQTQPNRLTLTYSEPRTKPRTIAATAAPIASVSAPVHPKAFVKYRWSFLAIFILAICATAIWAFWPGNASPVLAFLHIPPSPANGWGAPAWVAKPTYTLVPTF